jgi:hypothetical protein
MPTQLTARSCLFLFVRTHQQLQHYCKLAETSHAANDSGLKLRGAGDSSLTGNVVAIHPNQRSSSARQA